MTDKELIEYAAKAAGLELTPMEVKNVTQRGDDHFIGYMTDVQQWQKGWFNPLRDDDDALRLAVKLKLTIGENEGFVFVGWDGSGFDEMLDYEVDEQLGNDPYAATRRAIVRAAAEIGRQT